MLNNKIKFPPLTSDSYYQVSSTNEYGNISPFTTINYNSYLNENSPMQTNSPPILPHINCINNNSNSNNNNSSINNNNGVNSPSLLLNNNSSNNTIHSPFLQISSNNHSTNTSNYNSPLSNSFNNNIYNLLTSDSTDEDEEMDFSNSQNNSSSHHNITNLSFNSNSICNNNNNQNFTFNNNNSNSNANSNNHQQLNYSNFYNISTLNSREEFRNEESSDVIRCKHIIIENGREMRCDKIFTSMQSRSNHHKKVVHNCSPKCRQRVCLKEKKKVPPTSYYSSSSPITFLINPDTNCNSPSEPQSPYQHYHGGCSSPTLFDEYQSGSTGNRSSQQFSSLNGSGSICGNSSPNNYDREKKGLPCPHEQCNSREKYSIESKNVPIGDIIITSYSNFARHIRSTSLHPCLNPSQCKGCIKRNQLLNESEKSFK
ncbi:hypothetical protein DLAC_06950 [Tieghemostelium lacteum]|uniref:Uncharacterized protein n=1 Tax=Tieghemostelium lacteum TaxID=361077 RepID=A0A151ZDX6_TIELA|nr:hypothetical protein DLAC_06950 [Tieghemostelium lacteum]|eukprot:KYQ92110.1 hypothetical protein DLAC_06950 [Tieghemostelium lacteum]